MPKAIERADRQALKDEIAALRAMVTLLEEALKKARRCIASERHGREQLRARLAASEQSYNFAVEVLCRRAFPEDHKKRIEALEESR